MGDPESINLVRRQINSKRKRENTITQNARFLGFFLYLRMNRNQKKKGDIITASEGCNNTHSI